MASSGEKCRQRNCNACVKSKRRCDKRRPACGRCVKQRYPCVYGGRGRSGMAGMTSGDPPVTPFGLGSAADPISDPGVFMPDPNALPAMLETSASFASEEVFRLDNDFSSLLAPMPGTGNTDFMAGSWPSVFADIPGLPFEQSVVRKDYSRMTLSCEDYAPWQLTDPSTKAFFTLSVFKRSHVNFAHNSCTLYIHRHLYKDNMPRWMLQAFTMCMVYTNQTAANRAVVLRVLHENVAELKATAGTTTLTPQEKLARVHALMFYQTIRMFDGDITLGQQAEDDITLLESWNKDLCKIRDNLDHLASKGVALSQHPPESWERWIFAESLRRTCIMCVCIQRFWELLRTRLKSRDIANWAFCHRWTLSRRSHLWNAQNSLDFFRAWSDKPVYIISMFNFDDFLKTGTGDDLDDFSFYFLTLSFGVNEIKTFCHETSGRLVTPLL